MMNSTTWSVKIRSRDVKSLIKFISKEQLDISCGGPTRSDDGIFEVTAFVGDEKKNDLLNKRSNSMEIITLQNMTQTGIERQKEISEGNRFRDSRSTVRGLGVKE
jgi:hypothetical protein